MEAISRSEQILAGEDIEPISRKEHFLAKIAGKDVETPEPISREEHFLQDIIDNGGGSGGSGTNGLQWKCDNIKTLYYEFANYNGKSVDEALIGLDTSNVTNMSYMFYGCINLTSIPQLNTSKVNNMAYMFGSCGQLTTIPQIDTSKVNNMNRAFSSCVNLTTIPQLDTSNVTNMNSMFYGSYNITTIPQLDTSNVTNMDYMFYNCSGLITIPQLNSSRVNGMNSMFNGCTKLTTISQLDLIMVNDTSYMFSNCKALTNLTLKNIKRGLQISTGTSWGHLLTVDSLVNTVKELWDYSSGTSSYSLLMGNTNLEKIADVYVKLITPTDEQIANDPNINSKMPCEVCESTDDGAMTLSAYATLKKWTLR